jgi:hypothetical protein
MTVTVYHGTEHQFSEFEIGMHHGIVSSRPSGYIFLTSNKWNAGFYGDRVLTVEVTMHNPLVIEQLERYETVKDCADRAMLASFREEADYDGVIVRNVIDGDTESDVYVVWDTEQLRIVE